MLQRSITVHTALITALMVTVTTFFGCSHQPIKKLPAPMTAHDLASLQCAQACFNTCPNSKEHSTPLEVPPKTTYCQITT